MRFRHLFAVAAVLVASAAGAEPRADLLVSTEWLGGHLRDRGVTVVEIGERSSFEKEHIPGARLVALADLVAVRNDLPNELPPVDVLERAFRAAGVPDHGRIILYSRDLLAAARAFFTLDYLGCSFGVALLDGGFARWKAEECPLESGPPRASLSQFTARPRPDVLVNIGMLRLLKKAGPMRSSALAIVDARPPEAYHGSEVASGVSRPGHIPGAVNVPWSRNLKTGDAPVFRPVDELRALYRDAGVDERATVITYCRTGIQASLDYFVLRVLGRDVSLYDGSYVEWNCADDTPVEK